MIEKRCGTCGFGQPSKHGPMTVCWNPSLLDSDNGEPEWPNEWHCGDWRLKDGRAAHEHRTEIAMLGWHALPSRRRG